jgi:hypothetical protein
MPRRVIIGKHPINSKYGMWVSKPGVDAASSIEDDLLLDTTKFNIQPLLKGSITGPVLTKNASKSNEKGYEQSFSPATPSDGQICYEYDILFGVDYGFIPACFVTYSSTEGGEPYPAVLVKSDRLTLQYWRQHQSYYTGQFQQGGFTIYQFNANAAPSTYQFATTIHYTVFNQPITDTYPTGSASGIDRVILSKDKIKISRDGYDVNTSTAPQTSFNVDFNSADSNQRKYSGVFMRGTARTDTGTWSSVQISNRLMSGTQIVTRKYMTIPFGKTFSSPPQILYAIRDLNNLSAGAYQRYSAIRAVTGGTIGTVVWVSASTTELTLRVDYNTFGTAVGNKDWEFSYVVFQA